MSDDAARSSNTVKDSLRELDRVTSCLQVTPFDEVLRICDTFDSSADKCLNTLSLQPDKAELNQELKDCTRQVTRLQTSAIGLQLSVDRLLAFAILNEDKYEKMVRRIQEDDLVPVREYVELVKVYWIKTIQCFESSKTLYEETITITERSIEVQEARTQNEKTRTQAVGRAASVVTLAAAVGAGVVAGVLTFDVGALVVGTVVGLGAAAVTYKVAEELRSPARGLRQMREEMKLKQKDIVRLGDIVDDMETRLIINP